MSVSMNAYDLFKRGFDTLEIANMTRRSEASVLREINMARSARIQKPYPYPPYAQPGENPRFRGSEVA